MVYTSLVVPKQVAVRKSRKGVNGASGLRVEMSPTKALMHHRAFRDLPILVIEAFGSIASMMSFAKNVPVFIEGQEPRGVFAICEGEVKLSANSPSGKRLVLRRTGPGDLIGLPGAFCGRCFEVTAETLSRVDAIFMPRADFLRLVWLHREAATRMAEILDRLLHHAHQQIRFIALPGSAAERLGRFLLDATIDNAYVTDHDEIGLGSPLMLTHEEIAQMIDLSRETVTRLLGDLKRRRVVKTEFGKLTISNRRELEKMVGA